MSKNIVLCSDGTGNRGGKGNGTNVWRLFQAVDQHHTRKKQIAYYEDGVGTEDNKYWKLFTGATGFGFTRNVKELYKFLVKNYDDDDDIYLFGFSRGAYTVRALGAFITTCGVIKNGRKKNEKTLNKDIGKLVAAYADRAKNRGVVTVPGLRTTHPVKIQCIGVWDTVSAIGTPFDIGLKPLANSLFKFKFNDHVLNENVNFGFHALSIDDQRKTFHPITWNERNDVEQVWFAGVHSNVGGGYPKQGMANVALDWMMENVAYTSEKGWGLYFDKGLRDAARHFANVHDKLYDSRSGVAAYYRYKPRNIETLSAGGAVKIHDSAINRINSKTLGYNPGNVAAAAKLEIVGTASSPSTHVVEPADGSADENLWDALHGRVARWVDVRKALHLAIILLTAAMITAVAGSAIVALVPTWLFVQHLAPALFALVALAVIAESRSLHSVILSSFALVIFCIFQYAPQSWFGSAWSPPGQLKTILEMVIPELPASIILGFVSNHPFAAITFTVAFLIVLLLIFVIRRKLAVVFEEICDSLRKAL